MSCYLYLQTAIQENQIGLWENSKWIFFKSNTKNTLEGIFELITEAFDVTKLSPKDIEGYFFNRGPGNLLGLRIGKNILDSWNTLGKTKPIYEIDTLELLARCLLAENKSDFILALSVRQRLFKSIRAEHGVLVDYCSQNLEELENWTQKSKVPFYIVPNHRWGVQPRGSQNYTSSIQNHPEVLEYFLQQDPVVVSKIDTELNTFLTLKEQERQS